VKENEGLSETFGKRLARTIKAAGTTKEAIAMGAGITRSMMTAYLIKALLAVLGYGGWWLEKRRNRRLVRKEGDLRREKEYHDPVSTRSGLDKFGVSPADKGE